MIITKKALSRRTLLRGAGVSLTLPLLDAMIPAPAAFYHQYPSDLLIWITRGTGSADECATTDASSSSAKVLPEEALARELVGLVEVTKPFGRSR